MYHPGQQAKFIFDEYRIKDPIQEVDEGESSPEYHKDRDGVANKYKVSYIPTIVIIDKEGIIRLWGAGEMSASRLSSEIDKLL